MDTHTSHSSETKEFRPGSPVIYGMHGKCVVLSIETKVLQGESIPFYKLELKKSTFSRSARNEPAIWVPVAHAKDLGLRAPMDKTDAEGVMKLLAGREYFFKWADPWLTVQPQLEACIRNEGAAGLAKVVSFLFVLKRKLIVPGTEVLKLQESVTKLLFRELSNALGEPAKVLEERVNKGMKVKLIPDN